MSILGSDHDDLEQQALSEIRAAGRGDWKAAAWVLTHHPDTRERYSDFDARRAVANQLLDSVMKAATMAGLSAEQRYQFVLALQAVGLPFDDRDDAQEADP
jgi:hypothetical protein